MMRTRRTNETICSHVHMQRAKTKLKDWNEMGKNNKNINNNNRRLLHQPHWRKENVKHFRFCFLFEHYVLRFNSRWQSGARAECAIFQKQRHHIHTPLLQIKFYVRKWAWACALRTLLLLRLPLLFTYCSKFRVIKAARGEHGLDPISRMHWMNLHFRFLFVEWEWMRALCSMCMVFHNRIFITRRIIMPGVWPSIHPIQP